MTQRGIAAADHGNVRNWRDLRGTISTFLKKMSSLTHPRRAGSSACGALILDCAGLAGVRPVAAHLLPVFLVGIVEFELLASGAAIDILLRHIDEVLLAEAAFRSEERRVGKECRCQRSPSYGKKKQ